MNLNTPTSWSRSLSKMTSSLDLQIVLTMITQGLVDELDGAFARIWLLGPGDLCAQCHKATDCTNRECCLHLKASAGLYTNLNGEYRRIPLGSLKIGRIAQGWGPVYTNDVLGDDRLPNKPWMHENGLRSFAGYPLIFRGELLGVVAMFGRRPLTAEEFERLAVFANEAAIAIKNAQLFAEVEQLKNRLQAENLYLREEIKLRAQPFDLVSIPTRCDPGCRSLASKNHAPRLVVLVPSSSTTFRGTTKCHGWNNHSSRESHSIAILRTLCAPKTSLNDWREYSHGILNALSRGGDDHAADQRRV